MNMNRLVASVKLGREEVKSIAGISEGMYSVNDGAAEIEDVLMESLKENIAYSLFKAIKNKYPSTEETPLSIQSKLQTIVLQEGMWVEEEDEETGELYDDYVVLAQYPVREVEVK